jgi:hypothetical protein
MTFLRARGEHILLFYFAFAFRTLLCSCVLLLLEIETNLKKIQSGLEKMKPWALLELICFEMKNGRTLKNVCAKPLCLMRNVRGL